MMMIVMMMILVCICVCICVLFVLRYVEVNGHRPDVSIMSLMLNALQQSLDALATHTLTQLLQVLVLFVHPAFSFNCSIQRS